MFPWSSPSAPSHIHHHSWAAVSAEPRVACGDLGLLSSLPLSAHRCLKPYQLPFLPCPMSWPCPGYRLPLAPSAPLTFLAWSSLSRPFYILEFFRSSNPLMHDTSLNFPDSSNHQQQSLRNTARNQRTCPWPRCLNQYGISKPEENSATEDDLAQIPSLPTPCVSFLQ